MFAIGYNEINSLPPLGKTVRCWICKKKHIHKEVKDSDGVPTGLHFFNCGKKIYLCGINGKELTHTKI